MKPESPCVEIENCSLPPLGRVTQERQMKTLKTRNKFNFILDKKSYIILALMTQLPSVLHLQIAPPHLFCTCSLIGHHTCSLTSLLTPCDVALAHHTDLTQGQPNLPTDTLF